MDSIYTTKTVRKLVTIHHVYTSHCVQVSKPYYVPLDQFKAAKCTIMYIHNVPLNRTRQRALFVLIHHHRLFH